MAIVVSCIADDFESLVELAARQAPLADLVEVRLDRIGHPGLEALRSLVASCGKPVIVACNGPEAFGTWSGPLETKLELLRDAARAKARFVDIDWRLSLELGEVEAPCHRIVSRHELDGTPDDLDGIASSVTDVLYEGDVTKVVTHARSTEDGLALLRWLRTTKGIVSFTSGAAGSFTRVLAPVFGSPFTYCAPLALPGDAGAPTAPGQIPVNELLGLLPPGGVSQETAVFGVVGRPIGHSLSPRVHGMTLKAARLDAVYVAFEPESLGALLALADDENYRGFSITAPFKEEAFALAGRRDEGASRTRAVNTLVREEAGWHGVNTDVPAVRDTLERALALRARERGGPEGLADATVLVLGAGGAARAAAWAALACGGRVVVAGRTLERAQTLAGELGCEAVAWDAIPSVEHDVLVHATPVGTAAQSSGSQSGSQPGSENGSESTNGEPATAGRSPIPDDWIRPGTVVLDAVYRPLRTPLLAAAHARGCVAVPGGEWFVRQALAQFRLFTNGEPDEALLRASFEHAVLEDPEEGARP